MDELEHRLESIADELFGRGWSVQPDFLSPEEVRQLTADCRGQWESGEFRRAGVGIGPTLTVNSEIRRDHVLWLDEAGLTAPQRAYFERLEALRRAINRTLQLGLFSFEGHFAVYGPGAFYKKHLDNFRGARHRQVSAILYLNPDWQPEHGGQLRLYLDEAGEGEYVDIAPRAGTLATFLSARFYHEVLPARDERMSLTGWFRTRE